MKVLGPDSDYTGKIEQGRIFRDHLDLRDPEGNLFTSLA